MTGVLWLAKGLGRGGAEHLMALSGRSVDRERYRVEVAYVLPHKDALVGDLRGSGIPVHCLGQGRRGGVLWPARLRRLVQRRDVRIVHTHSPLPAAAARLALPPSVPIVHTEHNMWRRYRWPTYVANAATYRRNRAVIAVSHGVAASIRLPRWMPGGAPATEVVYHGIDDSLVRHGPDAAARARDVLGLPPGALVLGSVANFTPKKDQRTLLRALALLRDDLADVRLVLVGGGPLEPALRAQAASAGLDGRVVFAGSRDDVQEVLPAFDVFVLSSVYEGLSIALIEAMAAGVPCVATQVGGVPEVVEDGVEGLLVPTGSAQALAGALRTLLRDPDLSARMGARGQARARRFAIGTAVARMEALYDELLAGTP